MAIGNLSLFGMLKARMHWQQARQDVLSQNVANIDTPGFQPTDLKPPGFGGEGPGGVLRMVETSPLDIHPAEATPFTQTPLQDTSLEDQLMQVSQNATDFRLVSSLYSAGLSLIRTAAGS
jgi:flagellar basal-body rod protein FlgB